MTVGSASNSTTKLGPLQNKMQYNRVQELLDDSRSRGYRFALGPHPAETSKGYLMYPCIVDNPPEDSRIVVEEQFGKKFRQTISLKSKRVPVNTFLLGIGPIVPVMKYTDESEVIARANATKTGLAASVWGFDAERVGRHIEAGSVFINSFAKMTVRGLFSGQKESGIGGEWGSTGVLAYCNAQVMHVFK